LDEADRSRAAFDAAGVRNYPSSNEIGIAKAAHYPTLNLAASAGLEGSSILNWLTWPSRFWAVGPQLSETLFDAGRRRATNESARAGYDAAVADYGQTVLDAFQQVEDNLVVLRVQLFQNRYAGVVDTYLHVVTSQTTALTNERNDIDILRRRLEANVLLIKAMGGGWDVSQLPQWSEQIPKNYKETAQWPTAALLRIMRPLAKWDHQCLGNAGPQPTTELVYRKRA
jgi:outer membrane protein TolC